MYDVITVGSSTIDVFAKVVSEFIKIKSLKETQELIAYPSGSKILIEDLVFLSGGGGTNTAVSLSKAGLKVAYLGKIGNDTNSTMILKELKKEKVKFIGLKAKGMSGYSIILDSLEGDRTILTYKGVNDFLYFKEIDTKKLKTKWFYFSSMVNESYKTLEKLAEYAEKNNIKIAFNPSNYLAEKGSIYLKEVLSRTYLLVLNKEEAMLLAGNHEIKKLILDLMNFGPKVVIITDGKNGSYTINNNYFYQVIPNHVKSTETTGAGDAFASTFLACLIKGKNIEESLKLGTKQAESVISEKGAKKGLLTWEELLKFSKVNPLIVKKETL
ncbi:MAG: carbohydrate kinase family protein [Candidatus Woesearchaeota archaeon]